MKYIIDHDFHIHTHLSLCSKDEKQNSSAILNYAKNNGLKSVCITDHYWDREVPCNTAVNYWYDQQDFNHISEILPLPKDESVKFLFGCEADMDSDNRIGLPPSRFNDFDFIVVATTHFHHMAGGEWEDMSNSAIANRWIKRMYAVLDSNLPLNKVGIAHPSCSLLNKKSNEDYLETLNLISDSRYEDVFSAVAKSGAGVEINAGSFKFPEDETDAILRMYRIAKNCGCKFYLGSDAHHNSQLDSSIEYFNRAVDLLGLEESDKFIV